MECSIHFHERIDLSRTVGAVYDRAFGPRACESCAVIDRAYRGADGVVLIHHAMHSPWREPVFIERIPCPQGLL